MKKLYCLFLFALFSLPGAHAQQAPADTATWRDTAPNARHGLAVVKTSDNRTIHAYFPTNSIGFEGTIDYFLKNPEVRPFPKLRYVEASEVESVEMRGFHLENMRAAGAPNILAMRILEGPVALFGMSGKVGDKMPVLLAVVPVVGLFSTAAKLGGAAIERNRWFVRRNGQLLALKRASFREQMAQYMADCPALSAQVRQGIEGFHYKDTPNIVQLYNEFLQQKELQQLSDKQ